MKIQDNKYDVYLKSSKKRSSGASPQQNSGTATNNLSRQSAAADALRESSAHLPDLGSSYNFNVLHNKDPAIDILEFGNTPNGMAT